MPNASALVKQEKTAVIYIERERERKNVVIHELLLSILQAEFFVFFFANFVRLRRVHKGILFHRTIVPTKQDYPLVMQDF